MERVAVIGSGGVGRTLAQALRRGGMEVTVGVRTPSQAGEVPIDDAIAGASAVVVAIPGAAIEDFAATRGAALAGRLVLDASNDLSAGHGGAMHHMDAWARHAPAASVVRAFNTMGHENVGDPRLAGETADLLFCGPEEVRERTEEVIRAAGLRPVWLGGTEEADTLDGLTRIWFTLAFARGRGRRLAFRVLEEPAGGGVRSSGGA